MSYNTDQYPSADDTVCLLHTRDDDEVTVNDPYSEKSVETGVSRPCGMLEDCECGSLSCQVRDLQLPSSTTTIYESWTIVQHRPRSSATKFWPWSWAASPDEPGKVMSATPQTHFDQGELAAAVDRAREQYEPLTYVSRDYDGDLERRLRRLDGAVQDELYGLLTDRTENASNSFRRREYKLAVLVGVPGGDMTDAASRSESSAGSWFASCLGRRRDRRASSLVEYRVILRGTETKRNDAGWGLYSRFAAPWKLADEAVLANASMSMKQKGDDEDDGHRTLLD